MNLYRFKLRDLKGYHYGQKPTKKAYACEGGESPV